MLRPIRKAACGPPFCVVAGLTTVRPSLETQGEASLRVLAPRQSIHTASASGTAWMLGSGPSMTAVGMAVRVYQRRRNPLRDAVPRPRHRPLTVILGLDPRIHSHRRGAAWVLGSSPRTTQGVCFSVGCPLQSMCAITLHALNPFHRAPYLPPFPPPARAAYHRRRSAIGCTGRRAGEAGPAQDGGEGRMPFRRGFAKGSTGGLHESCRGGRKATGTRWRRVEDRRPVKPGVWDVFQSRVPCAGRDAGTSRFPFYRSGLRAKTAERGAPRALFLFHPIPRRWRAPSDLTVTPALSRAGVLVRRARRCGWARYGVWCYPPLSCRTSPPQGGRLARGRLIAPHRSRHDPVMSPSEAIE